MAGYFIYSPYEKSGIWVSSGVNKFRQFLSFATGHQTKALGVVIPSGTSGSFAVTGIGFQPDALLVFTDGSNFDAGAVDDMAISIGCATSSSDRWTGGIESKFGDITTRQCWWLDDALLYARGDDAQFEIDLTSFDADGFTLDIVTAPDQDIRIMGLALKHPSGTNFASGTELSPAANGTQSITCGFEPNVVLVAHTQAEALRAFTPGFARIGTGSFDFTNGQWQIWTGGSGVTSDPYIDQVATSGKALSMWIDADGAGPFDPTLIAEASISTTATGFDLNWSTTDGTQRYFSWLAIASDVESNRWTYNSSLGTQRVFTRKGPQGLFFYANDMGVNALGGSPGQGGDHNTETFSMGIGYGMCDFDLTQGVFDTGATDAHIFAFAELGSRYGDLGSAFGSVARGTPGGLPPLAPGPSDHGTIIRISTKRDHLLRMHCGQ